MKCSESGNASSETPGQSMCLEGALQRPALYKNDLHRSVSHGGEQANMSHPPGSNQRNRNNNSGTRDGHGNEKIADISWDIIQDTHVNFSDIVGCEDAIERIKESVVLPVRFPRLFGRLKAKRSHGIMLYGPPGTGK